MLVEAVFLRGKVLLHLKTIKSFTMELTEYIKSSAHMYHHQAKADPHC